MSNNPPEIKQGIKRTGSNRDQLLTKAVQDMSGGVAKLLKSVFLACTKPFANHIRGRRKDVRGQLGRRVTQIGWSRNRFRISKKKPSQHSKDQSGAAYTNGIGETQTMPRPSVTAILPEVTSPVSQPSPILHRPTLLRQQNYIISATDLTPSPIQAKQAPLPEHFDTNTPIHIEIHPVLRTASTIKFEDTLQVNSEQDALKELEKVVIFHGHADDYSISNYSSITAPITTSMPGDWSPVELGTLV